MESKQPLKYKLQVRICRGEKFFGPGVAQLMQLIDQHHSLHKATEEMHIAYSKAWRILKEAQKNIGFEIIHKTVGGSGGGGSVLTFKQELRKEADRLFQKYFLDFEHPDEK